MKIKILEDLKELEANKRQLLSSIRLKKDELLEILIKESGFAVGSKVKYRDKIFFIARFYLSDYDLTLKIETFAIKKDGKPSKRLSPFYHDIKCLESVLGNGE